jgi:hypothetical protein
VAARKGLIEKSTIPLEESEAEYFHLVPAAGAATAKKGTGSVSTRMSHKLQFVERTDKLTTS